MAFGYAEGRHGSRKGAILAVLSSAVALVGLMYFPQAFLQTGRGTVAAPHVHALAVRSAAPQITDGSVSLVARRAYTTAPIAEPPEDLMTIKQRKFVPSAEHLEYCVVEYSGRQHMVTEGAMYETHFIRAAPGAKVRFNRVLLLKRQNDKGEMEVTVGQPLIDGAFVEVTILEHLKSDDQTIYKHKSKKHYQKRFIVQQKLTRFRIDRIVWDSPDAEVEGLAPFPLWDKIPTA